MHCETTYPQRFPRTLFAVAIAFAIAMLGASAAFASETTAEDGAVAYDKALYYTEDPGTASLSADGINSPTAIAPIHLSDEMKYFARFESSQNYAQTFGAGDGYNAMGYYQFDRRYGLQNFIVACYEYDPETFSMFAPYAEIDPKTEKYVISIKNMTIRQKNEETGKNEFTPEATAVIDAWKAAYAADPAAFSGLQDAWAYNQYYMPAYNYLLSRGIDLNQRADCVKGLCWGMCNLFGSSGWRKFVGGVSDGYDWEGVYHYIEEGVEWPGCGLTPQMSDIEFVTALCNYAVENIPVFYKGQPQYHQGWTNRYKQELSICLEYLKYPADVNPNDWYVTNGSYDFITSTGLMTGYASGPKKGLFGPYDNITRSQVVTVLWRIAGQPVVETDGFPDVADGAWYTDAIKWASSVGITTGYKSGPNAGKFGPEDLVTREQLATFMYRFACLLSPHQAEFDKEALANAGLPDAGAISDFAIDGMTWCIDKGIMTGVETQGTFYAKPLDNAWRASMATMTYRLLTNLV